LEKPLPYEPPVEVEKANHKEPYLTNILMQAPVGLVLLSGENHLVELANEYYLSLVHNNQGDLLGKPIFETLDEAEQQNFKEVLDNVRTTGESFTFHEKEVPIHTAQGRVLVFLNITCQSIKDESGAASKIIMMVTDATDTVLAKRSIEEVVEKRTQELKNVNATLERSNKDLEQFAYIASHDLQEPLRKVKAFGDMLSKRYSEGLGPEGLDMIKRMQSASERMSALINDLLSYSRVSNRPTEFEQVNLNVVVAEVIQDLEAVVKAKQATINTEYFHPAFGDELQLRQLFQNLLSNALKFAKADVPPVVTITASLTIGMESGFELPSKQNKKLFQLIEVKDNGIGFEQQYAHKIFQLFQRLHGRSDYPGTGIGLSIVQKVVENHNGHIMATSEEGIGTTFRILLPASA
jgi:PAS domain S-box-containing protein